MEVPIFGVVTGERFRFDIPLRDSNSTSTSPCEGAVKLGINQEDGSSDRSLLSFCLPITIQKTYRPER